MEEREIFLYNGDTLPTAFYVNHKDMSEGDPIGKGKWGSIYKAKWVDREVAVSEKFNAKDTSLNVFLMSREVTRLLRLRHPNVLYLLGFYFRAQEDRILTSSMIMELMSCDLDRYMKSTQGASASLD